VTNSKRTLEDIFGENEIEWKEAKQDAASPGDRLVREFEEIIRFVDDHGREPKEPDAEVGRNVTTTERTLAIRLRKLREKPDLSATLSPHDRYGLLKAPSPGTASLETSPGREGPRPTSLDEIFAMDDGILSTDADDIFELRYVGGKKAEPDWVADRIKCDDFHLFKPLLDNCQADIESGKRKTLRFANEQEISAGDFFILNGILVYVAELNDPHIRNGRPDARLRCIFDNGTESDMLLRSLASQLYSDRNGRRVSSPEAGPLFGTEVVEGDVRKGYVYIAVSLSKNPQIAGMKNLYKVGVTTGKPERRIRRAEVDPTFLMAPARLLKTYTIYNADPGKVESILHAFFVDVCLDIEIPDRFGRMIRPREWFMVPLEAIEQAVDRLIDGTIGDFRYDPVMQEIVPKK